MNGAPPNRRVLPHSARALDCAGRAQRRRAPLAAALQGVWLLLLCSTWLNAQPTDRELLQQLVTQADAGETPFALAQSIGERGITAALVAAELFDERKPLRSQLLLEAIATAGTCRRSHPELLRLYQPAAHELFHTTNGLAGQQRLAVALTWRVWPAALPEAVVRAAPLPLLDWLRAQALSATPALDKLRLLTQPLGNWLRARHERQHTHAFHEAIAALTASPAITRDARLAPRCCGSSPTRARLARWTSC